MNLSAEFQSAKDASLVLARVTEQVIDTVLLKLAHNLVEDCDMILAANAKDLARMDRADPKYDRLLLSKQRLQAIAKDVLTVAKLPSPVGKILEERERPNGLHLQKISVPIGVIGIIYEARPNVTIDSFALCFKSHNACVLKGGSDAADSNAAIAVCIQRTLRECSLPAGVLVLLPSDRSAVTELLHARQFVDVLIPRGGQQLIEFVREKATVPVIETGAGIVHIYVDASADVDMAASIIFNAKTRRPSVCNSVDTIIVHRDALISLPRIVAPLLAKQVRIFADDRAYAALKEAYDKTLLEHASAEHFGTEYLSLQMSIVTVDSLDDALEHIRKYSSAHSESIVARDTAIIDRFLREVDAAAVYANASTAFSDGGEFGLGAEIGISTQKLHARGPMGLEALTSYKWLVRGNGQVRPS